MYFARPDSILDSISVARSRENMGTKLASTIRALLSPAELASIDVIIPIPETANTSAQKVSKALKKPFAQGFVKSVDSLALLFPYSRGILEWTSTHSESNTGIATSSELS